MWTWGLGPCVWGELFQGSGDRDWVLPWERHLLQPLPTPHPLLAPKIVLTEQPAAPIMQLLPFPNVSGVLGTDLSSPCVTPASPHHSLSTS